MRFRTPPRDRRALRGFTLMELMVVVTIIAISAGLAAPAITTAMASRRASEATYGVVRIGTRARSESMAYGRAHLLRFANFSTGGSDGRLQLWRGRLSACATNPWPEIMAGSCADSPNCIDELDMGRYDHSTHQVRLRIPGAGTADFCYEPSGEMMISANGGQWSFEPPTGTDAVRLTIQQLRDGTDAGVPRAVLFPFMAGPRVER